MITTDYYWTRLSYDAEAQRAREAAQARLIRLARALQRTQAAR